MAKEAKEENYVRWLSELTKDSVKLAGGKGANLAEMYNNKLPVPPAFVITSEAYKIFIEKTGLDQDIYKILLKLDEEKTEELTDASKKIRALVEAEEMPKEMEEEILEAYEHLEANREALEQASGDALAILKKGREPVFVAVRSSATAEDSAAASFAGQQDTFLNVKGKSNLIEHIKKCFSSLFTARSIYYRVKKGFKHEEVFVAVVVQKMIDSEKSGVMFSQDPVEQTNNVIVEAVYGLGEGIVSGRIKPDHYQVNRDLEILSKEVSTKNIAIVRNSAGQNETVKLSEERAKSQVLKDYEIKKLADYAIQLEKHYEKPQDVEFAVEANELYIVQTRPITTEKKDVEEIEGNEILKGIPASPGIGSGKVRLVKDMDDLKQIKKGEVLVTEMTNPDMVVGMQKSNAIVTDEGGMTCHAAIVSREMGIPCVVGSRNATEVLKEGMEITVNGSTGSVYEGLAESKKAVVNPAVETETHLKVIVDLPNFAERASKTGLKHVGLTRLEGIIATSQKHPFYFLKNDKIQDYEDLIYEGIKQIAEYFDEIWVRTSDIRTDEYSNLEGAPKEIESNPMLGMHGIRASIKYPEILKAELKALKRIKDTKIGLTLPQVISVEEVRKVKEVLKEIDFLDARVGVMIETPASVQIIEELCKEGIEYISFGTNDLTQYTLAIDRNNEEVQYIYDETHPAMLSQIAHVISVCKKYNVESSICGQAGSNVKMVEFLIKAGIDSISVNADKAEEISKLIKEMEEKGLKGSEGEEEQEETNMEEEQEGEVEAKQEQAEEKSEEEQKIEEIEEKIAEAKEKIAEAKKEEAGDKKEEWSEDVEFGFDPLASQVEESPKEEEKEGDKEDILEEAEDEKEAEEEIAREGGGVEKGEDDELDIF
ncbi:MAG: phosphoenolpyruvate synthase [archaeon]